MLRYDDKGDIVVNFPPGLLELIREAKCLDKLGFTVGEMVMNIALREQQYITLQESLKNMVGNYHRVLNQLDPSLRQLCSSKAETLRASMHRLAGGLQLCPCGCGHRPTSCAPARAGPHN